MPLKTLVVITLRLYAIYWFIDSVSSLVVVMPVMLSFLNKTGDYEHSYLFALLPLGMLVFAILLWSLSSKISAQVTKGHDTQLAFISLTKEDLYNFAFVFLGLFFILSSLAELIQSGYQFFAYDYPQPDSNPHKGELFWPFLGHAFTLIAGFACVFGAGKWTNKLIRLENKNEASPAV